jgi:high-affinity K+ transport system ATPase subunit B
VVHAAEEVAAAVGIQKFSAELTPVSKTSYKIKRLREKGRVIAMAHLIHSSPLNIAALILVIL